MDILCDFWQVNYLSRALVLLIHKMEIVVSIYLVGFLQKSIEVILGVPLPDYAGETERRIL